MCAYLGIDPTEDAYVKEVAHHAISAPLPGGFEEAEDETGAPAFRCVYGGGARVKVHGEVVGTYRTAAHDPVCMDLNGVHLHFFSNMAVVVVVWRRRWWWWWWWWWWW